MYEMSERDFSATSLSGKVTATGPSTAAYKAGNAGPRVDLVGEVD
jgi:hypothetical protein